MAQFAEYFTVEGDRWDTIAHKAYGDATNFLGIVAANPGLPLAPEFAGGVKILVPILDDEAASVENAETLPPWKRPA